VNSQLLDIVLFSTSACDNCRRASRTFAQLRSESAFDNIVWREVDVVAEIDYAVSLGVLATPAIAIGGKLVFTGMPTQQRLYEAIQDHLTSKGSSDE